MSLRAPDAFSGATLAPHADFFVTKNAPTKKLAQRDVGAMHLLFGALHLISLYGVVSYRLNSATAPSGGWAATRKDELWIIRNDKFGIAGRGGVCPGAMWFLLT
jgi:hypothetical protein